LTAPGTDPGQDAPLALITGASRGIGAAVARALAADGYRLALVARPSEELSALIEELAGAVQFPLDLLPAESASRLEAMVKEAFGRPLDVLVNNVGRFPIASVEDNSDQEIESALALNVATPLRLIRAFLVGMRQRAKGDIVTIGSIADRTSFPGNSLYGATKHAMRAVHETVRAETRGSGIRATLISPAATDTGIWDPYDPDQSSNLPSRADMLQDADVAEAVRWALARPRHVTVDELRLSRS